MRRALDYIVLLLGKKKLVQLTPRIIEIALVKVKNKHGIRSANTSLLALKFVMEEAVRDNLVKINPCISVRKIRERSKQKGLLLLEEAKKLFTIDWKNPQYKLINMLAMFTGMRMGEIQALYKEDLHKDYIHVQRAYGVGDGIKQRTKTGKSRYVPITPKLYEELMNCNPLSEHLVFTNSIGGIIGPRDMTKQFYIMLAEIGISEEERKKRNITFHSWRHFFNTFCRSAGVPDSKLQAVTGHSAQAMTEHYTHFNVHDFDEVVKAQKKLL